MTTIPRSTQLSTFSTVKTILKTSSGLVKFSDSDYYQHFPKLKSSSFGGFPFIHINIPINSDNDMFLGVNSKDRTFEVPVRIYVKYEFRDDMLGFINAALDVLDSSDSTFQDSGYYESDVRLADEPLPTVLDTQTILVADILLTLEGEVR